MSSDQEKAQGRLEDWATRSPVRHKQRCGSIIRNTVMLRIGSPVCLSTNHADQEVPLRWQYRLFRVWLRPLPLSVLGTGTFFNWRHAISNDYPKTLLPESFNPGSLRVLRWT